MQIALGRRGDYSVRAVLALARAYGTGRRKSREIAAEMDIPERYLPQILATLVRADVLVAVAGPDGGYELSRDPASITLLEVVECAEGELRTMQCMLRGGPCDRDYACPVHASWTRAQEAIASELARTTFAELTRKDRQTERRAYRGVTPPVLHQRPRRGVRGG